MTTVGLVWSGKSSTRIPFGRSYSVIPSTEVTFVAAALAEVVAADDAFFAVAGAANEADVNATRNKHDIHCFFKGSPLSGFVWDSILQLPPTVAPFPNER